MWENMKRCNVCNWESREVREKRGSLWNNYKVEFSKVKGTLTLRKKNVMTLSL